MILKPAFGVPDAEDRTAAGVGAGDEDVEVEADGLAEARMACAGAAALLWWATLG